MALRNKTTIALIWQTLERSGVQLVQFGIQLFLARLLMPSDFGIVAILNVFVSISNTLVNNGLSTALIQKEDPTREEFSSVFWLSLIISIIAYLIIFIASPLIASFYNNAQIISYLRILLLVVPIGALGSIQSTILKKRLDLRPSFIANLIAIVIQGIIGISLAFLGFGSWALVISQISYQFTVTLLLIIQVRWKPSAKLSLRKIGPLFKFSWKLSLGWLIGTLYNDIFTLIIGKSFSIQTLGFYHKGQGLPNTFTKTIQQITGGVLFSVLSRKQNNQKELLSNTRSMLSFLALFLFPIMLGFSAIAEPFVVLVLTEKWLPSVFFIRMACISLMLSSYCTTNMHSFNALGRTDIFLKIEFIRRSISVILVIFLSKVGIEAVVWGIVGMSIVSLLINFIPNIILLEYSIVDQFKDFLPQLITSIIMWICVMSINILSLSPLICIFLQITIGVVVYWGLNEVLRIPSYLTIKKNLLLYFQNK